MQNSRPNHKTISILKPCFINMIKVIRSIRSVLLNFQVKSLLSQFLQNLFHFSFTRTKKKNIINTDNKCHASATADSRVKLGRFKTDLSEAFRQPISPEFGGFLEATEGLLEMKTQVSGWKTIGVIEHGWQGHEDITFHGSLDKGIGKINLFGDPASLESSNSQHSN